MKHMKNTRFYNREHQMILIKPMLIIIFTCRIQFLKMNKYNKYQKIN